MNSAEDPEARIRELEQPLADTARASESGAAGGYSYPPPPPGPMPPPYGYNTPYPGTAPRTSSGMRWFWILAAVGVLGVLVLVGGIAAYVARQVSESEPAGPAETTAVSTAPGATRGNPPTGKTHAPSAGPTSSAAVPAAEPVIISGINENRSVSCDGNEITVSGISNTVTITGHCATVTVSGLQNIVTVETSDAIDASGLNNKITYHSGSPKISKSGSNNVVEQG